MREAAHGAAGVGSRQLRADAQRNYDKLVEAARALLAEQRGGDISMEEVARRAGVGIGTLYRHFPNRLALLETVYREDVEGLAAAAERLVEAAPPWEALEEFLQRFVAYAATKRVLFHELIEAVGKDSDLFTYTRKLIVESATLVLDRAQEAGAARPDVTPADLMRLVGGCTMVPDLEPDQQQRILRVVLDGIRV